MPPRRRTKNPGLPPRLKINGKGYIYYAHPTERDAKGRPKEIYLGKDTPENRRQAIEAAREANAYYSANILRSRLLGGGAAAEDLAPAFILWRRERGLAEKTLIDDEQRMRAFAREHRGLPVAELNTRKIALFLNARPATQANRYRALLMQFFRWAISEGHILSQVNPVEATIVRAVEVQRQRWTVEGFRRTWELAAPHEQNAMCLAIHTLQRPEDVVALKRLDVRDGILRVAPKKVSKYGVVIDIEIGQQLAEVIARCNDGVLSPYLVHQPLAANRRRRSRPLSRESFTRAVQRARDASGFYDHMPPEQRPTAHEIRSLGAKLYEEAGHSKDWIQSLLGHKSERQTAVYLSRHEVVPIRVPEVGLKL
jgi:integrase